MKPEEAKMSFANNEDGKHLVPGGRDRKEVIIHEES